MLRPLLTRPSSSQRSPGSGREEALLETGGTDLCLCKPQGPAVPQSLPPYADSRGSPSDLFPEGRPSLGLVLPP